MPITISCQALSVVGVGVKCKFFRRLSPKWNTKRIIKPSRDMSPMHPSRAAAVDLEPLGRMIDVMMTPPTPLPSWWFATLQTKAKPLRVTNGNQSSPAARPYIDIDIDFASACRALADESVPSRATLIPREMMNNKIVIFMGTSIELVF